MPRYLILTTLYFYFCAIALYGQTPTELLDQADILKDKTKYREAVQKLEEVERQYAHAGLETDSVLMTARYLRGMLLYNLNSLDTAIVVLNEALDLYASVGNLGKIADCHLWIGNCVWYQQGGASSKLHFERAVDAAEKDRAGTRDYRGKYYMDLGYVHMELGNLEEARAYMERGLALDVAHFKTPDIKLAESYMTMGTYLSLVEDYPQVLEFYRQAEEIMVAVYGQADHLNIAALYGNIGQAHFKLSNFLEALSYYDKALSLFEKHRFPPSHPSMILLQNGIGLAHYNMGNTEEALVCLKKMKENAPTNETSPDWISILTFEGLCYKNLGKYQEAKNMHLSAVHLVEASYGRNSAAMGLLYENLANNEYYLADRDDEAFANQYHYQALDIYRGIYPPKHPAIVRAHSILAQLYLKYGRQDSVLHHYNEAMRLIDDNLEDYASIPQTDVWITLQETKAHLLATSGDIGAWREALGLYLHVDGCLNYMRLKFGSSKAKKYINEEANSLYGAIITLCGKLADATGEPHFRELAFHFAEKSKGALLLEAVRRAKIPIVESLQQRIDAIGANVAHYEKRIYEEEIAPNPDTKAINEWKGLVFDQEQLLREAIALAQSSHPALLEATSKQDDLLSVAAIQQNVLAKGQSLLEYFLADSTIYAFIVRPDTFAVVAMPRPAELGWRIAQLREGIYGYYAAAARPDALYPRLALQYAEAAVWLHQALVAPVVPLLTTQVVLVPDGELGLIPFDALLARPPAQPTAFDTHDYLGIRHQLSITYSAILWREMREKAHKAQPKGEMLAMAPFFWGPGKERAQATYAGRTALPAPPAEALRALPHSGEECRSIAGPKSRVLLGAQASKAAFLSEAPHHRILHLSTHGIADDRLGDYAYLAFCKPGDITRFEKLYVRDLYGLTLHADLVVLSACQTATGHFQRGEGIISLTRAFTYAGAKGIVATLWDVSDEKTTTLMQSLHTGLRNARTTPGQALWKAKKDYLGRYKAENAHPYYWAGVIGIGI